MVWVEGSLACLRIELLPLLSFSTLLAWPDPSFEASLSSAFTLQTLQHGFWLNQQRCLLWWSSFPTLQFRILLMVSCWGSFVKFSSLRITVNVSYIFQHKENHFYSNWEKLFFKLNFSYFTSQILNPIHFNISLNYYTCCL